MPEITQSLIEAALSGDMQAAMALLNRSVPALKAQAHPITIPIKNSLPEQGADIIKANMKGGVEPTPSPTWKKVGDTKCA